MGKNYLLFLFVLLNCMGCSNRGDLQNEVVSFHEQFVDVEGASLFCRTIGKGEPLVVIHGGPGLSQDYLLPGLGQLAKNHFVIFYDQRGGGRSSGEIHGDTLHMEALIEDLDNIRRVFGFKKISLLGHSWGALLAARYALAHPESIHKLVISNPTPLSSGDLDLFMQEWTKRMTPYLQKIAFIQSSQEYQQGNPELHEEVNRLIFRTYCHYPENLDKLNLRTSRTAAYNFLKIYQLLWNEMCGTPFAFYEDLQTLQIPTLIVHGDSDPIPLSTVQNIHDSISGSKCIVIEQCGHFPYIEQPETYFNVLEEFLR
jgi:proline iminopeptidase